MKKLLGLSLLVWLLFLSGCAISHTYGPYMGKVVDKETEEPMEGAVVFMSFYTRSGNVGGATSYYADAVEVLTDVKGDFLIPPYEAKVSRTFDKWALNPNPIVFKPGYGAYPGHHGTTLSHYKDHELPDNEFVTIKLPKLKTREERVLNLGNISFTSDIPYEKWRILFNYRNIENIEVGLSPYSSQMINGK